MYKPMCHVCCLWFVGCARSSVRSGGTVAVGCRPIGALYCGAYCCMFWRLMGARLGVCCDRVVIYPLDFCVCLCVYACVLW